MQEGDGGAGVQVPEEGSGGLCPELLKALLLINLIALLAGLVPEYWITEECLETLRPAEVKKDESTEVDGTHTCAKIVGEVVKWNGD